jgi:diguanylate cyclase (GGDEF)-like protein/PAS domain S-box-containing protein
MDEHDNFYKDVLDNLHDGVYFVDRARRITYWNKGSERITGFTASEVMGRKCADNILKHVNEEGVVLCTSMCPLAYTMHDGKPRQANVFLHHKNGHRVPVVVNTIPLYGADNGIVGAIESFTDNSAYLNAMERVQMLGEAALQDSLTGVGNRRFVDMKLNSGISEVQQYDTHVGVLLFDIDRFKTFNDNYGHDVGDQVLQMVSNTINHNIRSIDFLGRWGGEEFIVLLQNINSSQVQAIANKLRMLVEQSFLIVGTEALSITVSGGATMILPGDSAQSLFKRVDQLLYQSKNKGRNQISFSFEA